MRPRLIAAAAAVLLLALTGCSGGTEAPAATTGEAGPGATESAAEPSTESKAAPLVADSAAPKDAADAGYLAEVRLRLSWYAGATAIPNATDEQLIAAGRDACTQLANGTLFKDLQLVEGEQRNADGELTDTGAIASAAILNYCPEFNVDATYAE